MKAQCSQKLLDSIKTCTVRLVPCCETDKPRHTLKPLFCLFITRSKCLQNFYAKGKIFVECQSFSQLQPSDWFSKARVAAS